MGTSFVDLTKLKETLGRIENRQLQLLDSNKIQDNEFQVYSQFGEDGIIQFLLRHLPIQNKIFVEFGVENYLEANTRFLLVNDNWRGLVMDGNKKNIDYIHKDPISWRHDLTAVHAFITRENINRLLSENGFIGDIGLLSIDVDGNDYWIWEGLTVVNPAIVIIEYNHRFGQDKAMTVPYDANFQRTNAHYSNIYYGASLKALYLLADQKGYAFVGCNQAGNNAFFVKKDVKPVRIKTLSIEEGFVTGRFRESRDESGSLIFLNPKQEKEILDTLPFVDVTQ